MFEIDSNNLGLTIDYYITDWYINDDLYIQKSLIYNSVSIFSLIENVEYIEFNFSGSSYKIISKDILWYYVIEIEKHNSMRLNILLQQL